jgi:2-phosphosulfolactate phosphatase
LTLSIYETGLPTVATVPHKPEIRCISHLKGTLSPEAQAAAQAYQGSQTNLETLLQQCSSGQELIERGFTQDVNLASELNSSRCVPMLVDRAYINWADLEKQI